MADMVIVTEIEYVTVYPSNGAPTPVISQIVHQPTLSVPETTMAPTPTPSSSIPEVSSVTHPTTSMPSKSSMAHPSTTGLPTLPSGWPAPAKATDKKSWDDSLAKLTLAGIIIMALILLSMIAYAIYQRFRGKCHKCDINENKLRKWESGELKRITKDMVKARETLNAQAPPAASDIDLEAGFVHDDEAARNANRATALAALNRPRSVVQKPSLFERAKGALKPKGKKATESPEPAQPSPDPSRDRFFAVAEQVTIPGPAYKHSRQLHAEDYNVYNDDLNRAYDPPTPKAKDPTTPYSPTSIYSYDGGSIDKIVNPNRLRSPTPERGVRSLSLDASVVSSALQVFDPRHRARYAEAQRKMEEGTAPDAELQKAVKDVNVIEAQMRGKRRSRGYGGLADPES